MNRMLLLQHRLPIESLYCMYIHIYLVTGNIIKYKRPPLFKDTPRSYADFPTSSFRLTMRLRTILSPECMPGVVPFSFRYLTIESESRAKYATRGLLKWTTLLPASCSTYAEGASASLGIVASIALAFSDLR